MFTKKNYYHLAAWVLFVGYEYAMTFVIASPRHGWEAFAFTAPEVMLFYAHLALMRRFADGFITKANWRYLIPCLLLLLGTFCAVTIAIRLCLNAWENESPPPGYRKIYVAASVFRCIYLMILSSALWLAQSIIRKNKQLLEEQLSAREQKITMMQLEHDFIVGQNELYKAKIKPHILFNTLNFIHSNVVFNEKASKGVLLLTDIMRFAIEHPDQDGMVSMEDEWQQVVNYLTLQKLRFEKDMHLHTAFVNHRPGIRIPPLIILTLVENMFMHGHLFDATHPASIQLTAGEQGWEIRISNRKKSGFDKKSGHGIGIDNIKGRLVFFYGPEAISIWHSDPEALVYELHLKVDFTKTKKVSNVDLLHN